MRFFGSALALVLGASLAMAQGQISEGQILQSLAGTGQAASAAGFDVAAMRRDIEERIRVEGTESAARPAPVLQELARYPNLTVQIEFDFDSDWIRPASWEAIGMIADALHNPVLLGDRFLVVGHTDAKGSRDYNLALSQRRADAVREMLVSMFRIAPDQLVAVGFGEEQLQDPSNPDAAVNRRVQFLNLGPR